MAKGPVATIDTVCKTIQGYFPDANIELVRKAFVFAEKAHGEQKRSSGDPYIIHPTEVAQVLAEMRLDISSFIAGFLHDTVEDPPAKLEDIRNRPRTSGKWSSRCRRTSE